MKQKHKKILGVIGLFLVVAMTILAASLPAPETQAVSTSVMSHADEIVVKVVGAGAHIKVNEDGGRKDSSPKLSTDIDYQGIDKLYVDLSYINGDTTQTIRLAEIPSGYNLAGRLSLKLNFSSKTYSYNGETYTLPDDFIYGEYSIHAYGYDNSEPKVLIEDFYNFKYSEEEPTPTPTPIPVPNTGSTTDSKINLMQTDYLITGLIIFLLVGISGFIFISRREKSSRKRRK